MPARSPPTRRQFLAATTGASLASALAGCFGDGIGGDRVRPDETEPIVDPTAERPMPDALVGQDGFVVALSTTVDEGGFPDPNPDVVPGLTKARFVAEASREAGEEAFADRVADVREPVLEPLRRFDAVAVIADPSRRERLNESQREELREAADLASRNVSLADDRETIFTEGLTDREQTFFDYPGPPQHVVEAGESRGLELLEADPDERAADVEAAHRDYVRQRTQVEAVVAGAREIATEAYDEGIEQIRNRTLAGRDYATPEAYAGVVAFNAGLAAESMLETDGELVQPP